MNRRRLLAFSLVVVVAAAWAYLVPATVNYLYYYSALDQLGVNVTGMAVSTYQSNVTVNFQLSISNPTSYVGLRLLSLAYQARPNGTINGTMDGLAGVGSANPGAHLDPRSTLQVPLSFVLTGLGRTQLGELCDQSHHSLSWSIEGSLGLETRDGSLSVPFQVPVTSQC